MASFSGKINDKLLSGVLKAAMEITATKMEKEKSQQVHESFRHIINYLQKV